MVRTSSKEIEDIAVSIIGESKDPTVYRKAVAIAKFPWDAIGPHHDKESILECARILLLKAVYYDVDATHFSPTLRADAVWHSMLLCPRAYVDMCIRLFDATASPIIIDHNPKGAGPQDKSGREERLKATAVAYAKTFGVTLSISEPKAPECRKIRVKDLTGRETELNVNPNMCVSEVKCLLQNEIKIPPCEQVFIHAGKQLYDHLTLSDCNIWNGTLIHLVIRLSGC